MIGHSRLLILLSTCGFLLFLFSSLHGFTLWYCGFVICLWVTLALLNYDQHSSFWRLKHTPLTFVLLYLALFTFGFIGDFFIGLRVTHAWVYPQYSELFDWLRLYLIVYPFGALSVLELVIFLGSLFHQRLVILRKRKTTLHTIVDMSSLVADILFVLSFCIGAISYILQISIPSFPFTFISILILWIGMSLLQLGYHLKHGKYWIVFLLMSLILLLSLHEVPNLFSHEWLYVRSPFISTSFPMLSYPIYHVPFWVILGWLAIILLVYKIWTSIYVVYFMENKKTPVKKKRS